MVVNPGAAPDGPTELTGIGVIVPYDMALDREMWRWAPDDVTLYFTRTPFLPMAVTVEMAEQVGDAEAVRAAARDLSAITPAAYAYACTSGSFVHGVQGERDLVNAMCDAGAPPAVTTSGSLLQALAYLGVKRVAIATPYAPEVTERLRLFLGEAEVDVVGSSSLGLTAGIWHVPYERTAELVRQANCDDAEVVFVSCTNLPTYDLITPLEQQLGKPVISANQATMWAALRAVGREAVGPGQRLPSQHRT
jgi:maleate isomerase